MKRHLRPRDWKFRAEASSIPADELSELKRATGLSEIALRVCLMRGLETAESIQAFLNPRFETIRPPSTIRDMGPAIERLARAHDHGELVWVFGDYDVDGTTGAALFGWVLRDFGFRFEIRQPDRFRDGYGLNVGAVEEAKAAGASVLLTVDCGITSFAAAERAVELGIDLVIVDHHQLDPTQGLPKAVAVINPQRADCESGLRQLCGCGLAFYVSIALRARGRELGWFAGTAEPNLKQHLDLVVLATAADMVPLTGDNHILVRHGLEVLKNTKKPGFRALLEAAGIGSRDVSPGHLGFTLGPRINASGRMGSASLALELLTTRDPAVAPALAQKLERMNAERAETQNRIWDEVRVRVEEGMGRGLFQNGVVVADPGWHEGVVGIVASRVTETFRRPAAVLAIRDGHGKGSVRSYGGKDVLSALRSCAGLLLGFGGHRHAAGLSIDPTQIDEFANSFDAALSGVGEEGDSPPLLLEGNCTLEDLSVESIAELERLGPFGPGNPEPVFAFSAQVENQQVLKGRHLKYRLGEKGTGALEAIWFHGAERELIPEVGQRWEWAGVPELNRFRGRVTPTIRVKDCRQSGAFDSARLD